MILLHSCRHQLLRAAIVAATLLAGRPARAQVAGHTYTPDANAEYLNHVLASGKGNPGGPPTGGSMLLPHWSRGQIVLTSGRVQRSWLKFDLAGQRLLWRRPAGDSLELDTKDIREFVLTDSLRGLSYTYRRYLSARIDKLALRTVFYEVRYDAGGAALLRRRERVPQRGSSAPSLLGRQPGQWREITRFYLRRADNVMEPVELNPKVILAVLGPDHAPALAAYVSRLQLRLTTEADVVKLLEYYDTLD